MVAKNDPSFPHTTHCPLLPPTGLESSLELTARQGLVTGTGGANCTTTENAPSTSTTWAGPHRSTAAFRWALSGGDPV